MYQKITLIGNLGRDPETRYVADGRPVCGFTMATNDRWTGQDGEPKERTTWFRVSVWGKQGENCQKYLSKGRQVLVECRLNPDPETGGPRVFQRQDGTYGATYEVTARLVKFLGGGNGNGSPSDEDVPPEAEIDDSSIPF